MLKYSAEINDYDCLNLTKLDVLDSFPTIQLAVAYLTPEGKRLEMFPDDPNLLERCNVEYRNFDGWMSSTKGIREWSQLPDNARKYVSFIEESVGVKVRCGIAFTKWPLLTFDR